ncbi:hypothetical protein BDA96_02G155900 [Sorghum bicolor]|uniref:PGG domain-containing protein n=2 Tax=Sorghum bicolor TaxID=4558 RepID=A0A921RMA2_SORBI|nr:uncharacterized protein LOC8062018 isoform X2 [Sorghum bicolor]KAG0543044.1 hypothetical protein BDA96_02G155900 [Sorghum bicolor]KXG35244.1 hypothetical protein SORBI_3002G149200 [Sorghum bicolor]|eukprot:XP_021308575.1 uncharacterized protein LOC8062018 isoform X2 [Sorghum bicolor]
MAREDQAASQSEGQKNEPQSTTEYQLKKYLLLLATLVATVTYAAGLNLPGGVWQDTLQGHTVGDPILPDTQHRRYLVFYYCNATAFTASLVVCLLVLALDKKSKGPVAVLLRLVMLLDLLALMGAYAAGSCRDRFTTIYSLLLMSSVFAYIMPALVAFAISKLAANSNGNNNTSSSSSADSRREEMHETLMLLTTFAVAVTYVAGLNPPGGFWGNTVHGGVALPQPHRVSHPVLKDHHPRRYQAFFVCNTTAFVVSLIIIMLLMDKKLTKEVSTRFVTLYVLVVVALLGLVGAYVAGSSRERDNTAYVIGLGIAVLACILLQLSLKIEMRQAKAIRALFDAAKERIQRLFVDDHSRRGTQDAQEETRTTSLVTAKSRELVMLLATLAASITYQAGLDPPGGLWQDDRHGHKTGESVLLTTHPGRYMVFFYSNSAAFVASLVVIMMVQSTFLLQRHTLEAALILDLFGLICAYAAGSCRDVSTSVYVVALAGVVLVYVVIHIIFFTLDQKADNDKPEEMNNKREVLLLLAILVATLTYQAGLTPPGGFWPATFADKSGRHHAGYPVLHDTYPKRYNAFFYCNAASFMTSVALILLLVNPALYKVGIRCYALYVCMVAGMFGLVGAYTAGSSRRLRTSIYVLVLAIGLFVFVTVQVFIYWRRWKCRRREVDVQICGDRSRDHHQQRPYTSTSGEGGGTGTSSTDDKQKSLREYLMLLGILAASVTYQTGLKPPGGLCVGA